MVYVGRAIDQPLGTRLKQHTVDRLNGRWDRFSWFGIYAVQDDGYLAKDTSPTFSLDSLVATMEAILIEGLEPPQNRKRGDGFSSIEFLQVDDPNYIKRQSEALLDQMKKNLLRPRASGGECAELEKRSKIALDTRITQDWMTCKPRQVALGKQSYSDRRREGNTQRLEVRLRFLQNQICHASWGELLDFLFDSKSIRRLQNMGLPLLISVFGSVLTNRFDGHCELCQAYKMRELQIRRKIDLVMVFDDFRHGLWKRP